MSSSSWSPQGAEDPGLVRPCNPDKSTGNLLTELLFQTASPHCWMMNFSIQDKSNLTEKFFITFVEPPSQWRRVTVSVDYRNAPAGSLEADLRTTWLQRDKSIMIYKAIREGLAEVKFYDSVTALKLRTTDGRLHVHASEDLEEIIDYPGLDVVRDIPHRKVTENTVNIEHHIGGFISKVNVDGQPFARKDIRGPDGVKDFVKQIRILGQLYLSPYVVDLYGVVLTQDGKRIKAFLMPFSKCGTLMEVINDNSGNLSWKRREKWAKQVVIGLSHMHSINAVHGHLTLSRIGLDDEDNVCILGSGSWGMSPDWAAPEIEPFIRSTGKVPWNLAPSDIYQLGMVLWALASQVGKPQLSPKPLLVTTEMDVPVWYKLIVESCLSPDPQDRPSAASLLDKWGNAEESRDYLDKQDLGSSAEESSNEADSVIDDDSLFDTASISSIATSISANSAFTVVAKDATTSFADLLDEAMSLTTTAQEAFEQRKLGLNAFRTGVRRLLKILSRDLSSELPMPEHRDVCNFFMSSSRQIAQEIANRAEAKLHHVGVAKGPADDAETGFKLGLLAEDEVPDTRESIMEAFGHESDAEEEGTVAGACSLQISALRETVASSHAFQEFLASLNMLICPSFESRLRRMSQVVTEKATDLDPDGSLREIVAELLYSKPTTITLWEPDSMSCVDVIKLCIEDFMGKEWEWWPLRPSRRRVDTGKARLHWRCRCGETRTAVLSEKYARYIVKLRRETMRVPSDSGAVTSSQPAPSPVSASEPATALQSTVAQPGSQKYVSAPQTGAIAGKYSPIPRPHLLSTSKATGPPSPQNRYVLFVVPGTTLRLAQIESTALCNESLFRKIRKEYYQAKGRLRSWFGLMVYSHCDFHKFEAWHKERYCEREIGIPAKDDQGYFYIPKPMDREPPISRHEFYDRFYRRVELEYCIQQRSSHCAEQDAVERIPQKKEPVDSARDVRPQFYGIIARERKSGLRMLIYVFVSSTPGIIFLFLWLFQWDHDSLQDAFGLLMASFTLLGILYAAQLL